MQIRIAAEDDLVALAELYTNSVKAIGPQQYSEVQIDKWASFPSDVAAFRHFILEPTTYIAEDESGVVGFCGISENGHIASLYVRGDRTDRGIGSTLLTAALVHAQNRGMNSLYAEASIFSLPLFLKFGFRVSGTEIVYRDGVEFERYLVEKQG